MRPFVFSALLSSIVAPVATQSCSSSGQQYSTLSNFAAPNNCVPTGYSQAFDLGNTNPTDATTRCQASCNSATTCTTYVAQLWKAADSGLYSGQCYLYAVAPSGPTQCAQGPSVLTAGQKDNSLACLKASASAATAFCSSYLGIPVKTKYTKTVTPIHTSIIVETSRTTTSTSSTSIPVVTSSTVISTLTTSSALVITLSGTTTTTTSINTVPVKKRAVTAVASPACLTSTSVPASRISSACSCLSVSTKTITTVSTAPTSTTRITTTTSTTSTVKTTTTTTSTTVTSQIASTVSTYTTSVYPATATATVNANLISNSGWDTGNLSPWIQFVASQCANNVYQVVNHDYLSPNYALQLTSDSFNNDYCSHHLVQHITGPVDITRQYTFTVFVKGSTHELYPSLECGTFSGTDSTNLNNYNLQGHNRVYVVNQGTYTTVSVNCQFTDPNGAYVALETQLFHQNGGSGTIYLDDFYLLDSGPIPPDPCDPPNQYSAACFTYCQSFQGSNDPKCPF